MRCPTCGLETHLESDDLFRGERCGRCKAFLPPPAVPIYLDGPTLDEIARKVRIPVLSAFVSSNCKASKWILPKLHELAERYSGAAMIAVLEAESNLDLFSNLGFRVTPAFTITKGSRLVLRVQGAVNPHDLSRWLKLACTRSAA